jgi:exopolyphosphatase/guanosine-5'-triphosphate,3'-diphosphate pyrophosphatase
MRDRIREDTGTQDDVAAQGRPTQLPRLPVSELQLVAVLDMGASAIRLVIAEIAPGQPLRIIEEASRGVLLGRDTFSAGAIRPQTIDATLNALQGFRGILDRYSVRQVRAVATSAVREARNGDLFLDRIAGGTGFVFETINEAEESRLVYLAVRHALHGHAALKGAATLLTEVGGGSTSLTLLRRGQPNRSGVYALGAVRLRQRLNLSRLRHDLQVLLLNRSIATIVEEIRLEIPLNRVTQLVAIGGDVRFAAAQIQEHEGREGVREISREAFLSFCEQVERLDDESLVNRFRLPAVEAEKLVPAQLI